MEKKYDFRFREYDIDSEHLRQHLIQNSLQTPARKPLAGFSYRRKSIKSGKGMRMPFIQSRR